MSYPHNAYEANGKFTHELVHATLHAIKKNYGRLISEARKEWEHKFASSDPSDSCVTVRISGSDSREFARLFPLEYSRRSQSFVTN